MQYLITRLMSLRWWLALLTVCVGVAVAWGNFYTTLDSTPRGILSEGDPYKEEVDRAREQFPPSTSVIFAFQTDTDVFNFPTLRAIDALTVRYGEIESAISVGSLLNRRLNAVDADRYDRDYLIPDLQSLEPADLDELRQIALADEDLTKSLLAAEGDMTLAVVKYKAEPDEQETRLNPLSN